MTFECAYCAAQFADLALFLDHVAERHGVAQCRRPSPRPDWRETHREHSRQQRERRWLVQEMAERRRA